MAKFEEGTESEIAHYYNDVETMRLVNSMANIIGSRITLFYATISRTHSFVPNSGIPVEEVWEAYGGFLIQFTMETGWDELLRAMASDLEVISERATPLRDVPRLAPKNVIVKSFRSSA